MAGWFDILRKTLGWPSSAPIVEVVTDEKPYVDGWSSVMMQPESYLAYDRSSKVVHVPESDATKEKL